MADSTTLNADLQAYANAPSPTPSGTPPQADAPSIGAYVTTPSPESEAPKYSETKQTQEPVSGYGDWHTKMEDAITISGGHFNQSTRGVTQLIDPSYTTEQARKDGASAELTKALMDKQDYENTHHYVDIINSTGGLNPEAISQNADRAASDLFGFSIESAPQIVGQIGASIFGRGAGAVIGGAFTQGKGSSIGADIGGALAPAVLQGLLTAGSHMYNATVENDVDPTVARSAALVTGSAATVATFAGINNYTKMVPSVASIVLKSQGFKNAVGALTARLAAATGINMTANVAQELAGTWADHLALSTTTKGRESLKGETEAFWQRLKESTTTTLAFEAGLTLLGLHAGHVALHEEMKAHTAEMKAETAALAKKAREAKAEAAAEKLRSAEVKEKTEEGQARVQKQAGLYDAEHKSTNVQAAQHALEVAEAREANAPKEQAHRASLETKIAREKVKQARYNAQVKVLDKTFNDPNLVGTLTKDARVIKERIETFEDELGNATAPADKDHWKAAIARAKKDLRDIQELLNLGNEDMIKARLFARQWQVVKKGQETKQQLARLVLNERIRERTAELKTLKASTHEDFVEDDVEAVRQQNKISNIELEIETDKMTLDIIDTDPTLKLEDHVDDALSKPAFKVRTLVGIANQIVEKQSNTAGAETRQFIKAAQNLLDKTVQVSRLAPATKKALQAKISALNFDKAKIEFVDLVADVNAAFDKESKKRAFDTVKKMVGAIGEDMHTKSKKPGTIEKLIALKTFAQDPLGLHKFMLDYLNFTGVHTEADMARWDIAQLFRGHLDMKDMNAVELKAIANTIVELSKQGESNALKRSQEIKANNDKVIDEFKAAMAPTKRGLDRLTPLKVAVRNMATVYTRFATDNIETSNMIATQFGKITKFSEHLNFNEAFDKYLKENRTYLKAIADNIEKAGVTGKQWAALLKHSWEPAGILNYDWVDAEGKTHFNLQLAEGEAPALGFPDNRKGLNYGTLINLATKLEDKEATITQRFEDNNRYSYVDDTRLVTKGHVDRRVGIGRSTLEVAEDALDQKFGPVWRQVRTGMQDFYQAFHPVVKELAAVAYGRELERNPTYGGPAKADVDAVGLGHEIHRRLVAGSTFSRVFSDQPVRLDHFYHEAVDHVRQNTRNLALWNITRTAHALYNDPIIKKEIINNIGERTWKNMQYFVDHTLLGIAHKEQPGDRFVKWFLPHLYSLVLSLNPGQLAAQTTGMVNIFRKVGPKAAYEGWAVQLADRAKADDMMLGSGKIQDRFDLRGGGRDREAAAHLNENLMGAVHTGDVSAVRQSFPVLWKVYKETGDLHKAQLEFARFVDETQSTGNKDMLSPIFSAGPLNKALTFLSSENVMQTNHLHQQWLKFRSTGHAIDGVKVLHSYLVITAAANLYAWTKYAMAFPYMNDKQKENNAWATFDTTFGQAFSQLPLIGGIVANMQIGTVNLVLNQKTKAWEAHMLPTDPINMFSVAQNKVMAALESGEPGWTLLQTAADLLSFKTGWGISRHVKSAGNVLGVTK